MGAAQVVEDVRIDSRLAFGEVQLEGAAAVFEGPLGVASDEVEGAQPIEGLGFAVAVPGPAIQRQGLFESSAGRFVLRRCWWLAPMPYTMAACSRSRRIRGVLEGPAPHEGERLLVGGKGGRKPV